MKKILVPTDFSDHSRNAGYYAVNLANIFKASIVLYHAYNVPMFYTQPVYGYQFPHEHAALTESERLENYNFEKLKFFRETILKGRREPKCSIIQQRAFVNDGISHYADESEADLIVMGTRRNNQRCEFLIATTTWGVIRKSNVPVLAVPEGYKFGHIENICFATDLNEGDKALILLLTKLAKVVGARLTVIHVSNKSESSDEPNHFDNFCWQVACQTGYEKLDFVNIENHSVSDAIIEHLKDTKTDLIALAHARRNLIEQMFHRSNTRNLVLQTEIPLLAFKS